MSVERKKISPLKKIIFSIIPLLMLFLFIEIVFNIVYFQRKENEVFATVFAYKKWINKDKSKSKEKRYIRLREHAKLINEYIEPWDNYIAQCDGLSKKKYLFRTDSQGFIEPSFRHIVPDLNVFFLGGSTTECCFVNENERFVYLSGVYLDKLTGKKINTINSGVSGNHTYHSINILFNKIIPLKPDICVLMENINDWTTLFFEGSYYNENPSRSLIIDLNQKSKTIDDEWENVRNKNIILDTNKMNSQHITALKTFITLCRLNGIKPILMTQPNRYKEVPDSSILTIIEKKISNTNFSYVQMMKLELGFNENIRKIAREENITLIDLEKEIPKTKDYIYDIVHLNSKGCIKAAEIISKQLKQVL